MTPHATVPHAAMPDVSMLRTGRLTLTAASSEKRLRMMLREFVRQNSTHNVASLAVLHASLHTDRYEDTGLRTAPGVAAVFIPVP